MKLLGFIDTTNRTSALLSVLHVLFLLIGLVILGRILYLQFFYTPDPKLVKIFTPPVWKQELAPVRGDILSHDGAKFATSIPTYQVYMDCTVRKAEYEGKNDGAAGEKKWREKAGGLAEGLARIYGDRNAQSYRDLILANRDNRGGRYTSSRRNLKIGSPVDYNTLQEIKALPLFNEGQFKGGIKVVTIDKRTYPYGSMARKAVGTCSGEELSGLERKFDGQLRGEAGWQWMKVTDAKESIPDTDSTNVKSRNGLDIRTTIDMGIQDAVDKALREAVAGNDNVIGGCTVVMDVETGAIRAISNLRKESGGHIGETFNYAARQKGNPGSVMKAATLMALLEDGKIKLEDEVPTFKGKWALDKKTTLDDEYLMKWPEDSISISDGVMISSNNVFRYLSYMNYKDKPEKFIKHLKSCHLLDSLDFDSDQVTAARLREPDDKGWSMADLYSYSIGYSVFLAPMQILTFYNAIAAGGKMMKPYLAESIEDNGKLRKQMKPQVMDRSICSKATADTITRALLKVTKGEKGTAHAVFKDAPYDFAGKTGTARIEFYDSLAHKVVNKSRDGRKRHQATFVGYFPAENPKYSIITVTYSRLMLGNVYGNYSAKVVREVADHIWNTHPEWNTVLTGKGRIPSMQPCRVKAEEGIVPDAMGLTLTDALYLIENSGYSCVYEGCGHVTKIYPDAGSRYAVGNTVKIIMR